MGRIRLRRSRRGCGESSVTLLADLGKVFDDWKWWFWSMVAQVGWDGFEKICAELFCMREA